MYRPYAGKTIGEMSREDLIQAFLDVGAELDRERRCMMQTIQAQARIIAKGSRGHPRSLR